MVKYKQLFYFIIGFILMITPLMVLLIYFNFCKECVYENYSVENDSKIPKSSRISLDDVRFQEKKLTFPSFHFHANHPGFLHIGNFLLQWGSAETHPKFPISYGNGKIMGAFCIPYATNTGKFNLKYVKLKNDGIENLERGHCETPIMYLAYGFKEPTTYDTKITYSKSLNIEDPYSTKTFLKERFLKLSSYFRIRYNKKHERGEPEGCKG